MLAQPAMFHVTPVGPVKDPTWVQSGEDFDAMQQRGLDTMQNLDTTRRNLDTNLDVM